MVSPFATFRSPVCRRVRIPAFTAISFSSLAGRWRMMASCSSGTIHMISWMEIRPLYPVFAQAAHPLPA